MLSRIIVRHEHAKCQLDTVERTKHVVLDQVQQPVPGSHRRRMTLHLLQAGARTMQRVWTSRFFNTGVLILVHSPTIDLES